MVRTTPPERSSPNPLDGGASRRRSALRTGRFRRSVRSCSGRTPLNLVLLLLVVALSAMALVGLAFWLSASSAGSAGYRLGHPALADTSAIQTWQSASNSSASTFPGNATIWVHGNSPTLLVLMSPPVEDMEFDINGLPNPTLHVAPGTHLTLIVVNMDASEFHNWVLTRLAPPYGEYPMMMGGGMMGGSFPMWGTSMMGMAQGGMYWSQTMSLTAPSSGTWWYLCTYPGHAAEGMYGSFLVG